MHLPSAQIDASFDQRCPQRSRPVGAPACHAPPKVKRAVSAAPPARSAADPVGATTRSYIGHVSARSGCAPSWPLSRSAAATERRPPARSDFARWARAWEPVRVRVGSPEASGRSRFPQIHSTTPTVGPSIEPRLSTSEFCPKANPEKLGLIEFFLPDRVRDVEPNRTDRRFPRYADPAAHPNRWRILDHRLNSASRRQLRRRQVELGGLEVIERAEIGENPAADAEFFGQAQRDTQGHRADVVFLAAEGVIGDRVARPDSGILKAAQIVAADKESILKQYLLTIPAKDVACLTGKTQYPFRCNRVIIAEIHL